VAGGDVPPDCTGPIAQGGRRRLREVEPEGRQADGNHVVDRASPREGARLWRAYSRQPDQGLLGVLQRGRDDREGRTDRQVVADRRESDRQNLWPSCSDWTWGNYQRIRPSRLPIRPVADSTDQNGNPASHDMLTRP